MARTTPTIRWLEEPAATNYPGAVSYLSLIYSPKKAKKLVADLDGEKLSEFKAKDIFRAAALPLLGPGNFHVKRDRAKIRKGERLSPILLVRDPEHGKVIIADGYHRLCAIYSFHEDAVVRCKICGL